MGVKGCLCGMCHMYCGVLVTIEDGKIVNIEGDPTYPTNRGRICGRPKHAIADHYHPKRLSHPLKRLGGRGEGRWQRISWDQALDEIADKLKEIKNMYGGASVSYWSGTSRFDHWPSMRFLNLFGSPNYCAPAAQCWGNDFVIESAMVGSFFFNFSTPEKTKLIVFFAHNPAEMGDYTEWWATLDCLEKGTKSMVIDPRCTETARRSDWWLQCRPGSDGALLLGWINIIIKNGLYDRQFVEEWTNAAFLIREDTAKMLRESDLRNGGSDDNFIVWDEVDGSPKIWSSAERKYRTQGVKPALSGTYKVRFEDGREVGCKTVWTRLIERVQPFTPEKVEELTWVPAEEVLETARVYATLKPGVIPWSNPHDHGRNATNCVCSKVILRLITGQFDVFGGEHWPWLHPTLIPEHELMLAEKMAQEQRTKQIGAEVFRLFGLPAHDMLEPVWQRIPRTIRPGSHLFQPHPPSVIRTFMSGKPYPVKAAIVTMANPLVCMPETKLTHAAFKSLELLVVMDKYMTPTAMLADYLFPAADWLEKTFLYTFWGAGNFLSFGEKAVEPMYERREDYYFWRELGTRLGQSEYWPRTKEEVYAYQVKPMGWTFEDLKAKRFDVPPAEFRKHEKFGFATFSGLAEIYPIAFEKLGYDPLPNYVEPFESPVSTPKVAKEYPLILITGTRFFPMFHSENRAVESMRRMHPYPIVEIHPDVARELDPPVADGDWIWIETRKGRCKQRAKVTPAIHPRVVSAQHGWWFPELPAEEPYLGGLWDSNINVCTNGSPENCDPVCGGWPERLMLCKIYKVETV